MHMYIVNEILRVSINNIYDRHTSNSLLVVLLVIVVLSLQELPSENIVSISGLELDDVRRGLP